MTMLTNTKGCDGRWTCKNVNKKCCNDTKLSSDMIINCKHYKKKNEHAVYLDSKTVNKYIKLAKKQGKQETLKQWKKRTGECIKCNKAIRDDVYRDVEKVLREVWAFDDKDIEDLKRLSRI